MLPIGITLMFSDNEDHSDHAGGTGGTGANGGSTGGTSSFGSHFSATGGNGGNAGQTQIVPRGGEDCGAGGSGSGGDLNIDGGNGLRGFCLTLDSVVSSVGGTTPFCGHSESKRAYGSGFAGINGKLYGGGGGGAYASGGGASTQTGGSGRAGIVIVYEYF